MQDGEHIEDFHHELKIENMENKKYSLINNYKEAHFLFIEIVQGRTKGVVLVLEIIKESNNHFYIKTGFYRAANKVKKLLRKQNTH